MDEEEYSCNLNGRRKDEKDKGCLDPNSKSVTTPNVLNSSKNYIDMVKRCVKELTFTVGTLDDYFEGKTSAINNLPSSLSKENIGQLKYLLWAYEPYRNFLKSGMDPQHAIFLFLMMQASEQAGEPLLSYSSRQFLQDFVSKLNTDSKALVKAFPKKFNIQEDLNFDELVNLIENELSSNTVKISWNDLNILLLGKEGDTMQDIQQKLTSGKKKYNPKYELSLEMLQKFRINLIKILGDSAADYIVLIDKCILANPDLKIYSRQKHTIKNPDYFSIADFTDKNFVQYMLSDIDNMDQKKLNNFIEKFYWFAALCGDGSVDFKRKDINFEVEAGDIKFVQAFADVVGFEREIKPISFYDKRYDKTHYKCVVEFGCELMVEDLKQLGWFGGNSEEKHLPSIVKELIKHAKQVAIKINVEWTDTNAGKVALAWLLGFYDTEGSLGKDKDKQFVIYATYIAQGYENEIGRDVGKELLEEIKEVYGIHGSIIPRIKGSSSYKLFFNKDDLEFFEKMLFVYEQSMDRKRPDQYKRT